MACDNNITNADIAEASTNLTKLNTWLEGNANTSVTFGSETVPSPSKMISDARLYKPAIDWSVGITISDANQSYRYDDVLYAPRSEFLPFVTGAAFDGTKWYALQLILSNIDMLEFTTDIISSDHTGLLNVLTSWFGVVNDDGGNMWTFTGVNTVLSAGTFDLENGFAYDTAGNQFKINLSEKYLDVRKFGALGTDSPGDIAIIQDAATYAKLINIDLFASGNYTLTENLRELGGINRVGNGLITEYGIEIPWSTSETVNDIGSKYYSSSYSQTQWDELVPSSGIYNTFPMIAKNRQGIIIATWMHQTEHVGSLPADVSCKISKDNGYTWSNDVIVYGTLIGTDTINPYYQSMGTDRLGRFVIVFGKYASNPGNGPLTNWITRSYDGLNWSDPIELTIIGTGSYSSGSTLVQFGEIKILPSGKLGMCVYQGDDNYVGIIDDNISETTMNLILVINSSTPTYSEMVFLPITETIWIGILRLDGQVGTIPYLTTEDGGSTWVSQGNIGDNGGPDFTTGGGGWIPQIANVVTIDNIQQIMFTAGARKSVSGTIPDAPTSKVFITPVLSALTNSSIWRRIHQATLSDDGYYRDLYLSVIFDDVTGNALMITNEEILTSESRILTNYFNYRELASNTIESWDITLTGIGGTDNTYTGTPNIKIIKRGKIVTLYGSLVLSAINTTGALSISGLPYKIKSNAEIIVASHYQASAAIEDIYLRGNAGQNSFLLIHDEAGSSLDSTEVNDTFNLRFSGTYFTDD